MWIILEHRNVRKALVRAPTEIQAKYEAWKQIVIFSGPGGLRSIKGFHDEALRGQWIGYRSSRLGIKWRVIYSTELNEVLVIEITPHDYRRK